MEEGIEKILEAFPLSWKGKKAVIKPNILGPSPSGKAITTHPSLIRGIVKSLRKRGALCLVGDNPGLNGYAANGHCARVSGIFDAADSCFVSFAKETVQLAV